MAISNAVLEALYQKSKWQIQGGRIDKILFIDAYTVACIVYNEKKSRTLLLSFSPTLPLLAIGEGMVSFSREATPLIRMLKKYAEYGTILNFEKVKNDRIFIFTVQKRTETFQKQTVRILFECIPMHSNLMVIDEDDRILDAYRKSFSLDAPRPIQPGLTYRFFEPYDKRIVENEAETSLQKKVSKKEFAYLLTLSSTERNEQYKAAEKGEKFYWLDQELSLFSLPGAAIYTYDALFQRLLSLRETSSRSEKYREVVTLIEKKRNSLAKKQAKLEIDAKKNQTALHYVEWGNALYTATEQYEKGMDQLQIDGLTIPLSPLLSLQENASRYFKQYQKAKTGQQQIRLQQEKTAQEIVYFDALMQQITFAQEKEMQEIVQQLVDDHYIKTKRKNQKKKKQADTFQVHQCVYQTIPFAYGLSSFQNDYLTFTLAHKEHYFFHVKDQHGPHVIAFSDDLSKDQILFGCEIALFFAKLQAGEVMVTKRKNVKKIPAKRGLVQVTTYESYQLSSLRENSIALFKNAILK